MDLVNDLFHVIIAGIVLGAGLPLIYALAIRFSVPKQGAEGHAGEHVSGWQRGVAGVLYLVIIAAAVIGGTLLTGGFGYVLGSVVGALVLGLLTVLITRDGGIRPEMTTIITGGILLAFVLLQRLVTRSKE